MKGTGSIHDCTKPKGTLKLVSVPALLGTQYYGECVGFLQCKTKVTDLSNIFLDLVYMTVAAKNTAPPPLVIVSVAKDKHGYLIFDLTCGRIFEKISLVSSTLASFAFDLNPEIGRNSLMAGFYK